MQPMSVESVKIRNQPLRRYTRAEYDDLVAKGMFVNERVELMFGMVVDMSPIDPSHIRSTLTLLQRLMASIGDRAEVACQMPIAATEDSEPEPDIYVTPSGPTWSEHASRAYLVVEVSNSSLAYDRTEKALLYGLAQIDEYWIVDLVHGLVEIRRDRDAGVWRTITTYRRGDTLQMLAFPDVTIAVSEILPPI
jgi:Uma2 family endonuclease